VVDRIGPEPALVVATPGAEPAADGGYTAGVLLDGWAGAGIGGLDASVEALTRWLSAASLVRPTAQGGEVLLLGGPDPAAAAALVRWDPAGFAARDLDERRALRFPPAVRMVELTGPASGVEAFLAGLYLPPGAEVLGPTPNREERSTPAPQGEVGGGTAPRDEELRALIRAEADVARQTLYLLRSERAAHSARSSPPIRLQPDPPL
jgi:primosomal protein N' (replication factor Y)